MSLRHIAEQRRNLIALGKALLPKRRVAGRSVPGPVYCEELPPPAAWLVDEYVRLVGGEPAAYRHTVPPHFFAQWAFPGMALALDGSGFGLAKIVNAGCELQIHSEISRERPICTETQLLAIEDKGHRVLLRTRVSSGNPGQPGAVVAIVSALVPTGVARTATGKRAGATPPTVPRGAVEVRHFRFSASSGARFANLTGDYNPIHWSVPYARLSGFPRTILHGFGALAWSFEGLVNGRLSGRVRAVTALNARFSRPLLLPGQASLFVGPSHHIVLGDGPGGVAYLEGSYETR